MHALLCLIVTGIAWRYCWFFFLVRSESRWVNGRVGRCEISFVIDLGDEIIDVVSETRPCLLGESDGRSNVAANLEKNTCVPHPWYSIVAIYLGDTQEDAAIVRADVEVELFASHADEFTLGQFCWL